MTPLSFQYASHKQRQIQRELVLTSTPSANTINTENKHSGLMIYHAVRRQERISHFWLVRCIFGCASCATFLCASEGWTGGRDCRGRLAANYRCAPFFEDLTLRDKEGLAVTDLGGLQSSCLPLASQLALQVFDLGLQQLDHLLVVLLGAAGLPWPHLGLGHLQATLQPEVLLHRQTRLLRKKTPHRGEWRPAGVDNEAQLAAAHPHRPYWFETIWYITENKQVYVTAQILSD